MDRRQFLKTAAIGGAVIASGLDIARVLGQTASTTQATTTQATTEPHEKQFTNPFDAPGKWYKANLHTHTTLSDGKASPAQRSEQYRKAGYDVLLITDHLLPDKYKGKLDITGLSDDKMLVISGMEYHPFDQYAERAHLLAVNVPYPFSFSDPDNSNKCIQEVAAAGGVTWLGHPHWCGFQFDRIAHMKGLAAMEVYNAVTDSSGFGTSDNEWTAMLAKGWRIPCLAVDDIHDAELDGEVRGWTMLKMPALTAENVIQAITTGCCYATSGPEIKDFRLKDGKAIVSCSPAARITFMGMPGKGKRFYAKPDKELEFAEMTPVSRMKFVRAVVTDAQGRSAWTQPIWL